MTIRKAIETLEEIAGYLDNCPKEDEIFEALSMAEEALEKHIPKKPIKDDVAENIFYCPTCTRWFNGYHKPHHCICDQAIDWEAVR